MGKYHIKEGNIFANILIYLFSAFIAFITLYPVYYVIILSLSEPQFAATMRVYFWPRGFYIDSYKSIVNDSRLWMTYRNTFFYALSQTIMMLITCTTAAYSLSIKGLKFRKGLIVFLLIPMYFSGGIIPLFILIINLGIYNTPLALILPGSFSIWYIILVKSYFGTIPDTLRDAARIDGANHYQTLLKIFLPTSKSILAVIALYTIISAWNSWFWAALFISDSRWQPLQLYLRRILVEQTIDLSQELFSREQMIRDQERRLSNIQLKYTIIVISTLPMLIAYPFFQKYFVKGVMLGSLKE